MSSEFGKILKVSLFGQSHGRAVGVLMEHLPAGEAIDEAELLAFLGRRKPKDALSTQRKEEDIPIFLSGVLDGKTCGSPLCAILENKDARSEDYGAFQDIPRPSHADYTAFIKWGGLADMRGGGHFSGRLTAPLCIAGGIAKQILVRQGIFIGAHLFSVGEIEDAPFPLHPGRELFTHIADKSFPTIDDDRGQNMQQAIHAVAKERDSLGGIIECAAIGLPAGLGSPLFEGIESKLASAMFGIPAVKGISFGDGFLCATQRGSAHNDPFTIDVQGNIILERNGAGGVNGGITNGMPILFRVAIKPTPSIGKSQKSIRLSNKQETELVINGRHDPCVAHRAVPAVEAVTAIVLLDIILEEGYYGHC